MACSSCPGQQDSRAGIRKPTVDNTTRTAVSLPHEGSDDCDHDAAVDDVHDDIRSPEDVAARWWD
jgi:hypothetical protein